MESLEELKNELQEHRQRTEAALQEADGRYRQAERRFRVLCGVLLGAIAITTILPFVSPAVAQGYSVTLASLAARVVALENKTANMSVLTDPNTSQPTVRFSNVNVQIVSGSGTTEGAANGRGNLIVGYNELHGENGLINDRNGSHNLIIGAENNYTVDARGGLVGGFTNTIAAIGTFAMGNLNTASGDYSSVAGGPSNTALGRFSSVFGGGFSTAQAASSSVSGGYFNTASGRYSSVAGGYGNEASGLRSSVSGGRENRAQGEQAVVASGYTNTAFGEYSSVLGGFLNRALGQRSSISGGDQNTANSLYTSVSGGFSNFADGNYSSISGGDDNATTGYASSVSGGSDVVASGIYQWIGGSYHSP